MHLSRNRKGAASFGSRLQDALCPAAGHPAEKPSSAVPLFLNGKNAPLPAPSEDRRRNRDTSRLSL